MLGNTSKMPYSTSIRSFSQQCDAYFGLFRGKCKNWIEQATVGHFLENAMEVVASDTVR